MSYIQPEDREQTILFNSIEDMVLKNNPVRIIDAFIDKVVSESPGEFIRCKDSNTGAPSYLSTTLLKIYFYGYLNMVKSSRKLEAETYRNIEIIWLIGNLHPDHWTISQFRKEYGTLIKKMWKKFQYFLKSNNYIDLKTVAIDGTKVKAYTKREMQSLEELKKMLSNSEKKLDEYLQELKINDKLEAIAEAGNEAEYSSAKVLIDKIATLEERVEELLKYKEEMESSGISRLALSDKESKLMKSRDGKQPCYNVEAATDSKHHMIADFEVSTDENDVNQLIPVVELVEEEYEEKPLEVLVDSGFYTPDALETVLNLGIDVYCAPKSEYAQPAGVTFEYDKENDVYRCSEGKELKLYLTNVKRRNSYADAYRCSECNNCTKFGECTESESGRMTYRYKNADFRENYAKRMRTPKGREKMKQRRCLVEHPFGTIKYLMGKIPLLLRGVTKVATEISLYVCAYNFKRLINIESFDIIMNQISALRC